MRENRYVLWDTKYHTTRFAWSLTKLAQTIWLLREADQKVFAPLFFQKVASLFVTNLPDKSQFSNKGEISLPF